MRRWHGFHPSHRHIAFPYHDKCVKSYTYACSVNSSSLAV